MELAKYPSIEDGPHGRGWAPAVPSCGGGPGRGYADKVPLAFKFSVKTGDGVTHRFLMTREGMAWLAWSMVEALSPRLARPMFWWYRRQRGMSSQSAMSSGMSSRDGSPQAGQAE